MRRRTKRIKKKRKVMTRRQMIKKMMKNLNMVFWKIATKRNSIAKRRLSNLRKGLREKFKIGEPRRRN